MPASELRATAVDLSGLFQVLSDHLYSTPAVAVRELVQNAHDSIVRRRIEDPAAPTGVIRLHTHLGLLEVEDDGSGLTEPEIVRYLATVGTGYTRQLRGSTGSDELIGLFGLGFLSAFVVADEVELLTTSYQEPTRGWRYRSRDGQHYTLEPAPAGPIGTRVRLRLKGRFTNLSEESELLEVLDRYAALLPIPVQLGGRPINAEPPPWRTPGATPTDALAFARRFDPRFDPLCVLPVAPPDSAREAGGERGGTDVRGLLWLHDQVTYGTSDNRKLSVFVRGMLLDDDHHDLVPAWAGFVSGVIESARLTPTASREDLQRDDTWAATAVAVRNALVEGLRRIAETEPETWRRIRWRHNEALLGASLCDPDLFAFCADALTVPTSEGDLPVRALLARGQRRVYVSLSRRGGFEETVFRALKLPIVSGTRYGALAFATRYAELHGGTVVQLGTEAGDRQVFREVALPADLRAWLHEQLAGAGQVLVPARFAPAELPLVVVPDREAELKKRVESDEADKHILPAALRMARLWSANVDDAMAARLYVNLDSPAIQRLIQARAGGQDVSAAARLLRGLGVLLAGAGGESADLRPTLADFTTAILGMLPGAEA